MRAVSPPELSSRLGQALRGAYGSNEAVSVQEAAQSIRLAKKMVASVEAKRS